MQKFTPIEYLKIDIASNFGLDKDTWDNRLAWFADNEENLDELMSSANEPALFYAGIQAYRKALAGEPITYPVSLDATASGAQLLALLIGCEKSARLCNVLDTGAREDLYTNIYRLMCARIGDEEKISRDDAKRAIMTSLYGSSAVPKQVFGEGELYQIFLDTMNDEAPGIWQLNQALIGLWNPTCLSHDWILPDNFNVRVKVMDRVQENFHFLNRPYAAEFSVNQPMQDGLSLGANLIHSIDGMVVREMTRRCSYDRDKIIELIELIMSGETGPRSYERNDDKMVLTLWEHYENSGFLSARILDHLDARNIGLVDYSVIMKLLKSLPEIPFKLLSIHDCFRVHPNYGNDLRSQYNQILHEIAGSTLLQYLASQITKTHVNVTKYADIAQDVLTANYALS